MKKICFVLFVCTAPAVSWGQVIDTRALDNFDVQAAVSCDKKSAVCQQQIADINNLLIALLQHVIALQESEIEHTENVAETEEESANVYPKTPRLTSDQKTFVVRKGVVLIDIDEDPYYKEISRIISETITEKIFNNFSQIIFIEDEDVRYAARVRQSILSRNGKETEDWKMFVNMADVTLENEREYNQTVKTLVHEAGHAFLTNTSQIDFFTKRRSCDTVYIEDLNSCAREDSYYAVLSQYWSEDYLEWTKNYADTLEDDPERAEQQLGEYYIKHINNFITEYAASSIHEDAAETMAAFAVEDFPTGLLTLAEEKIVALFDFKEMRVLKNTAQELLR